MTTMATTTRDMITRDTTTEVEMSGAQGIVAQINTSPGGVPKLPRERVHVTFAGLDGDWQLDRKHHGGPDRAVCLYSADLIEALQQEGHSISPGSTGENLTLRGLDWALMQPGAVLHFAGGVELELTSFAPPCRTIQGSFQGDRFVRIGEKTNPGWSRLYARVVAEGELLPGASVEVSGAA